MKTTRSKSTPNFRLVHNIKRLMLITLLGLLFLANPVIKAESRPVPFERDVMMALLQKTIEIKLIPYSFQGDGMSLTITKLLGFAMDWERNQFTISCAFSADNQKFIRFSETGEVTLTGSGLLAPADQKLGVKLARIDGLKLDHGNSLISEGIRIALEKSLAGREFWQGDRPNISETLTKDNFATLLLVALNQRLPFAGGDDNSSFTINHLEELTYLGEPGQFQARFTMQGTHKSGLMKSYEGQAGIRVYVTVDPGNLSGKIKIDQLTELDLKNSPGLFKGIIRALVNAKLKGTEIQFVWK